MASVFSIESINLNGDILTASDGSLYINNNLIKNTSGIQLSDRFFIKGYAPISFYSKWPQQGNYLNETYLNDFFMATGLLVTCSQPTTGTQPLFGGFYSRPASSAIDTSVFTTFELQPKQISQSASLNYKIDTNKIIGLNIYNAPEDMRSISIHLLGYFPAAAHFDRMPKQVNFYAKNIPTFSSGIHEEYSQWDSVYSGFGIYCGQTGIDNLTFLEPVTGYISGTAGPDPSYYSLDSLIKPPCNPCEKDIERNNFSGYFLSGNSKINFPTKNTFSGFSGQIGFSTQSGFQYSGFQIDNNGRLNNGTYLSYSNDTYSSGEMLQTIGWRSGVFKEKISGFISGYVDQFGVFNDFGRITTGVSGSGIIFNQRYEPYINLDTGFFKLDLTGYIIGSSGYFINGKKYFFPANRPISYNIIGFISGYMDGAGQFTGLQNLDISSGSSGYFVDIPSDYVKVFFPTGNLFSGLTGMYAIYTGSGYSSYYTGFSFPLGSGFSGIGGASLNTYGQMTGIIGAANVFIPFSGFSGRPNINLGLGFDYIEMHYDINEDFFSGWKFDGSGYTGEWVGGIGTRNVSGRQDITGFVKTNALYDFKLLSGLPNNTSGLSGYLIDGKIYMFSTGAFDPIYNKFPKFENNQSFTKYGYEYSGFFPNNSGFSGIGYSGIKQEYITGFVSGYRDVFGYFNQFANPTGGSGFITGNQRIFFPTGNLFSGFSGFSGFNNNLGFLYTGGIVDRGFNFVGDNFINSGSGILTGFIGWRNIQFETKEYGTGIMTGYIGYRNTPYSGGLTGTFYHKDKNGNKILGPKFGLSSGQYYNENFNLKFNVPSNNRVGIDVYNPLSGISDINIVLFGYYE